MIRDVISRVEMRRLLFQILEVAWLVGEQLVRMPAIVGHDSSEMLIADVKQGDEEIHKLVEVKLQSRRFKSFSNTQYLPWHPDSEHAFVSYFCKLTFWHKVDIVY